MFFKNSKFTKKLLLSALNKEIIIGIINPILINSRIEFIN